MASRTDDATFAASGEMAPLSWTVAAGDSAAGPRSQASLAPPPQSWPRAGVPTRRSASPSGTKRQERAMTSDRIMAGPVVRRRVLSTAWHGIAGRLDFADEVQAGDGVHRIGRDPALHELELWQCQLDPNARRLQGGDEAKPLPMRCAALPEGEGNLRQLHDQRNTGETPTPDRLRAGVQPGGGSALRGRSGRGARPG